MIRIKLIFLLAAILLLACESDGGNAMNEPLSPKRELVMNEFVSQDEQQSGNSGNAINTERKIIKTGSISFKVEELDKTSDEIKALINNNNAYIIEERGENQQNRVEKNLTVKVPAVKFEEFIAALEDIAGKPANKHISSEDISERYIDTEVRLKAKQKLEDRYLELLNKANNVSEIMQIERELNNIRADIESAESILKSYDNQISYSQLNIYLYKEISTSDVKSWGARFAESFVRGWDYFIWFFVGLTSLWPFILVAVIIVLVILKFSKRKGKLKHDS